MAEIIGSGDLSSYPGTPKTATPEQMTLVLGLANGLVSDIIGTLTPVPTKAKTIALEVAARGLRNPEGASSVTQSIDDWSETVRFEGGLEGAGVYLTEDEEAALRGLVGRRRQRIGTIRVGVIDRGATRGCW